jgi:hypothetical protein
MDPLTRGDAYPLAADSDVIGHRAASYGAERPHAGASPLPDSTNLVYCYRRCGSFVGFFSVGAEDLCARATGL